MRAVARLRATGLPVFCKIVGDGPEESTLRKEIKRTQRADWVRLAQACERPEWIDDPRFLTSEGLEVHKPERLELTQQVLRSRTSAEWIVRLEAHDVPCAPVLTRREMIRHPQVVENGIIVETEHPQAGRLRQTRTPARFSGTPAEHRRGGPVLGGDTREVLAEAGYSATEIDTLIAAGAAAVQNEDAT